MNKFFNRMGSGIKQFFSAVVLGVFTVPAFANPPAGGAPATVKDLASSVNFSDVAVAILAIAGSVVAIYVTWKGAQFVIKQVRGA